jgi:amidohydrolase
MPAVDLPRLLASLTPSEQASLMETRRQLHRRPELAFQEHETAALAAGALSEMGLTPKTGVGKTGVVADVPSGGGKRLLARADMDALPIQEETGLPFASEAAGRMHACGHDGHVAIALAVARRIVANPPPGAPLRFLFQPAEEGAGGAQACAADGVLDGVGAAFGLHLWTPLPVGFIGINRGALMAAVDEFVIDVEGPGGHGASPHETADTILATARIIEALQAIVAREISPLDPAVVTVASISGGSAFNIIPKGVRLTGTARSFTESAGAAIPAKMRRIVEGVAAASGVTARLVYTRVNEATVNDAEMADLVIGVARRLLGEERVVTDTRTLGGEDMSVYLRRVPGCFFFVGASREDGPRAHHSPRFDIDERALGVGVLVMEAVLREAARRI